MHIVVQQDYKSCPKLLRINHSTSHGWEMCRLVVIPNMQTNLSFVFSTCETRLFPSRSWACFCCHLLWAQTSWEHMHCCCVSCPCYVCVCVWDVTLFCCCGCGRSRCPFDRSAHMDFCQAIYFNCCLMGEFFFLTFCSSVMLFG